jgi:hypothetical protein
LLTNVLPGDQPLVNGFQKGLSFRDAQATGMRAWPAFRPWKIVTETCTVLPFTKNHGWDCFANAFAECRAYVMSCPSPLTSLKDRRFRLCNLYVVRVQEK